MKNKVRFTNAKGETFESITEGTSEEILSVFGDDFKSLLAPMNRLNPLPALPPALPPAPPQHYLPPPEIRTVVQEVFQPEPEVAPVDVQLQALEREVDQARASGQWGYPPMPTPQPQPPQPTDLGDSNPTIQSARVGLARLLTLYRNPWFWFDFVILPIIVLASLPATKPFVAGMPFVGKPIVGVMDTVVKAIAQPPKPATPEKPKPSPKGSDK